MYNYGNNIIQSGLTIYEKISIKNHSLYIPNYVLAHILGEGLIGEDLAGLPLRTRSKVVKCKICKILIFTFKNL